jgi:Na+-transporting methylmalonyl-CoA/oxaloacetate decarboxylase beta subunit
VHEAAPEFIVMGIGQTLNTGGVLTVSITFWVNDWVQFGVTLVVVIPVICRVCPLFAAVSAEVENEPFPVALAITPVTGVWATPFME